ncbi:MAG: hypothetical protein ACYSUX_13075, partial [Planctomycetota bacterium]
MPKQGNSKRQFQAGNYASDFPAAIPQFACILVVLMCVHLPCFSAERSAIGSSRADVMLADYFGAETAKLRDRCLTDVKTLEDWQAKRKVYREQLFEMLGLKPLPEKTDLKPVITGKLEHEQFTVENIHYQSSPGLYVTGNLYIPKGLKKPAPTILYVCGHAISKKNNISYGNKTAYQHHG